MGDITPLLCRSVALVAEFDGGKSRKEVIICSVCGDRYETKKKFSDHFSKSHRDTRCMVTIKCSAIVGKTRAEDARSLSLDFEIPPPKSEGENKTNPPPKKNIRVKAEPRELREEPSVSTKAKVDTLGLTSGRPKRQRKRRSLLYPGEEESEDDSQNVPAGKKSKTQSSGARDNLPVPKDLMDLTNDVNQEPIIETAEESMEEVAGKASDEATEDVSASESPQKWVVSDQSPNVLTPRVSKRISQKHEAVVKEEPAEDDDPDFEQDGFDSPPTPDYSPKRKVKKEGRRYERRSNIKCFPSGTTFHCPHCDWKSNHHFNFHRHILVKHNSKEDTRCPYCKKSLTTDSGGTGYGFKKFTCADCPNIPPMNKKAFQLHVFRKHAGVEPMSFMCDKCGYKCYKACNFKRHACGVKDAKGDKDRGHVSHAKYFCMDDACDYQTQNHYNFHRHIVTSHLNVGKSIKCDFCNKDIDTDVFNEKGIKKKNCDFEGCSAKQLGQQEYIRHVHKVHDGPKPQEYVCEICGYTSDAHFLFKSHMETHKVTNPDTPSGASRKNQRVYVCEVCGYEASQQHHINRHIKTMHEEKTYNVKCDSCEFVTFDEYNLKRHVLAVHKKNAKTCPDCGVRVTDIEELKTHLTETHSYNSDFRFMCTTCGKVLNDSDSLTEHKESHARCHVFVCYRCEFAAISKQVMREHFSNHDDNDGDGVTADDADEQEQKDDGSKSDQKSPTAHLCDECDFETTLPAVLRRHKKMHILLNNTNFVHCGTTFPTINEFNKHLMKVHVVSNFRYQCMACGLILANNSELKKHRNAEHKPIEQYMCNQCDFTCLRRWNLLRHKEVKHNPVLSCQLCDYTHRSKNGMIRHYTKHHMVEVPEEVNLLPDDKHIRRQASVKNITPKSTPQPRTVCNICGKSMNKFALKKHMEMHQGVKTFKCHHDNCDYTTRTSYCLRQHIYRKHLGAKPLSTKKLHSCLLCPYTTKEKSRFIVHIGSKHKLSLEKHDALHLIHAHEAAVINDPFSQTVFTEEQFHTQTISAVHDEVVEGHEGQSVVETQHVETIYHQLDAVADATEQVTVSSAEAVEMLAGNIVMMPENSAGDFSGEQTVVMLPHTTEDTTDGERRVVMLPGISSDTTQNEQTIVMLPEGADAGIDGEQIILSVSGEHGENTVYQIVEYQ